MSAESSSMTACFERAAALGVCFNAEQVNRSLLPGDAATMRDLRMTVLHLSDDLRVSRSAGDETWLNFDQEAAVLPDGSEIGPVSYRMVSPDGGDA